LKKYGHLKSSDGYFPFIFNGYISVRFLLSGPSNISDFLHKEKFEGISGVFGFNSRGNVIGGPNFILNKLVDGKVVLIENN
jgi:hypothetical protein